MILTNHVEFLVAKESVLRQFSRASTQGGSQRGEQGERRRKKQPGEGEKERMIGGGGGGGGGRGKGERD